MFNTSMTDELNDVLSTKNSVTTVLIAVISEIAGRSSFIATLLASIPLVSVLVMIWLYTDTKDSDKVSDLAASVFWPVIPSLALFVMLSLLLKQGVNFISA